MIEKSVMKVHEYDDSVTYRVACDCGSPECDMLLDLEIDSKIKMIFLTIYKTLLWSSYWGDNPWYTRIWMRLTCAVKMILTGYIEVTESFVMQEDQVNGLIKALEEGKQILSDNQKE